MTSTQIAVSRLSTLGCDKLPKHVKDGIVKKFAETAMLSLIKLADKTITTKSIAKAFVSSCRNAGSDIDYLELPTAIPNESNPVAGTTLLNS